MDLKTALNDPIWKDHKIGDSYAMIHVGGKIDNSNWKIAYYPLFGTYKNEIWVDFEEPRALVEMPIKDGTDFREVPLRYLQKNNKQKE